ncbi:hypothetical protein [Undibacterium sp. CY21W]|uniref:hypothetical protein n=1 Tax=Undibacterium sp. CY21W TaxID=2762293 RepID=UPI00164A6CE5|nr:hypothetical protein [Undibacterium sp. CY21W]MBC3926952.1 hypothetical protein [Undibacterium sp. CY21W]
MDTARNKQTHELVEAEELWSMETVDSAAYICRGCPTQVFPASYDKANNKKRPYFTLGPVNKHVDCDVDGEEKVVERAKKDRIGTPEGFPLPFPNKLTLTDERPAQPDGDELQGGHGDGRASTRGAKDGTAPRKHHGHTVKTIRPACRAFINFPYDRSTLPLEIPGVTGNTYAKIFEYLGSKKPEHFKSPTRLYYAAIRWTAAPIPEESHCDLTLNAGEWDEEKGGYKAMSRVRVHWTEWSKSRRDTFMREFNTTREEAKEKAKTNKQVKGWIFFVGSQDEADPGLFHVHNHRLICCLEAEMIWTSKK